MELILDTNIYRNLITGKNNEEIEQLIKHIKETSLKKNIKISFPINSAMELIAHYNDINENEKLDCRNALKLLVEISTKIEFGRLKVNFIPPLNVVLAYYFFETEDIYMRMYASVITIAQKLVGNVAIENTDNINDDVDLVKSQIEFEKNEIKTNYENYLKSINSGNAEWTYFEDKEKERVEYFKSLRNGQLSFLVAQSFIERAYTISGNTLTKDEDFFNKVINFMRDFCPALVMNEFLLEKIGHSVAALDSVKDKRWNTIIDISLIFGTLYNPKGDDKKLVTQEKQIKNAFDVCGYEDNLINLDDFLVLMDIK